MSLNQDSQKPTLKHGIELGGGIKSPGLTSGDWDTASEARSDGNTRLEPEVPPPPPVHVLQVLSHRSG